MHYFPMCFSAGCLYSISLVQQQNLMNFVYFEQIVHRTNWSHTKQMGEEHFSTYTQYLSIGSPVRQLDNIHFSTHTHTHALKLNQKKNLNTSNVQPPNLAELFQINFDTIRNLIIFSRCDSYSTLIMIRHFYFLFAFFFFSVPLFSLSLVGCVYFSLHWAHQTPSRITIQCEKHTMKPTNETIQNPIHTHAQTRIPLYESKRQ